MGNRVYGEGKLNVLLSSEKGNGGEMITVRGRNHTGAKQGVRCPCGVWSSGKNDIGGLGEGLQQKALWLTVRRASLVGGMRIPAYVCGDIKVNIKTKAQKEC